MASALLGAELRRELDALGYNAVSVYTDGIEGRDTPAEDHARALLANVQPGRLDDIVEAFVAEARGGPASEADDLVVLVAKATGTLRRDGT